MAFVPVVMAVVVAYHPDFTALDELLTQPVHDLPQAQLYATVCHYLLGRERVQEDLRHCGGILLDAPPQKLPAAMINQYLDLKRGGRL